MGQPRPPTAQHEKLIENRSSIFCAPQLQITTKSPFNVRENDGGEFAASDEQGGSSERSRSNSMGSRPRYMGDGFINISQEILNSVGDDHNE